MQQKSQTLIDWEFGRELSRLYLIYTINLMTFSALHQSRHTGQHTQRQQIALKKQFQSYKCAHTELLCAVVVICHWIQIAIDICISWLCYAFITWANGGNDFIANKTTHQTCITLLCALPHFICYIIYIKWNGIRSCSFSFLSVFSFQFRKLVAKISNISIRRLELIGKLPLECKIKVEKKNCKNCDSKLNVSIM